MASDNLVWISPLRSGLPVVDRILQSLSQWLANKSFQVGTFAATIINATPQITGNVTFSDPFPNACTNVFLNVRANTHNYGAVASAPTPTGFSFDLFTTNAGNVGANTTWTIDYVAFGN